MNLGKVISISDDVGKIFNFIATQINLSQTNSATLITQNYAATTANNENKATTTQQLCDNIRELIQETNKKAREREARRMKTTMENIWYKKLNERSKKRQNCEMKLKPKYMIHGQTRPQL